MGECQPIVNQLGHQREEIGHQPIINQLRHCGHEADGMVTHQRNHRSTHHSMNATVSLEWSVVSRSSAAVIEIQVKRWIRQDMEHGHRLGAPAETACPGRPSRRGGRPWRKLARVGNRAPHLSAFPSCVPTQPYHGASPGHWTRPQREGIAYSSPWLVDSRESQVMSRA